MPIESILLKQHNLLYRRLCGLITIKELEDDSVPIYENPDYLPGTDVVFDAQRVMDFDFGFKEMRDFVGRAVQRLEARKATVNVFFVGDRLMGRSIAKMFVSFTALQDTQISVYIDFDLEEVFTVLDVPISLMDSLTQCRMPSEVVCPVDAPCRLVREFW